jgi:hypothetical protein
MFQIKCLKFSHKTSILYTMYVQEGNYFTSHFVMFHNYQKLLTSYKQADVLQSLEYASGLKCFDFLYLVFSEGPVVFRILHE